MVSADQRSGLGVQASPCAGRTFLHPGPGHMASALCPVQGEGAALPRPVPGGEGPEALDPALRTKRLR